MQDLRKALFVIMSLAQRPETASAIILLLFTTRISRSTNVSRCAPLYAASQVPHLLKDKLAIIAFGILALASRRPIKRVADECFDADVVAARRRREAPESPVRYLRPCCRFASLLRRWQQVSLTACRIVTRFTKRPRSPPSQPPSRESIRHACCLPPRAVE